MKKTVLRSSAYFALVGALISFSTPAVSAPTFFFGEDLTAGSSLPVPNSAAAEASFLSNLIGVGTEDFEGIAVGSSFPLAVNLGGSTATINGTSNIANTGVAGAPIAGRFAISGDRYLNIGTDDAPSFNLTFDVAQAAFGFYATDIGDISGLLTLSFDGGAAIDIPHTVGSPNGSAFFWGIIDIDNPFMSVQFGNSVNSSDAFGFDDFTIGTRQQVTLVSEPTTLALLLFGSAGLIGFRRRRTH